MLAADYRGPYRMRVATNRCRRHMSSPRRRRRQGDPIMRVRLWIFICIVEWSPTPG